MDEDGNAAADAAEAWEEWQRKHAYTGEQIVEQAVRPNSEAILEWAATHSRGSWWRQAVFGTVGVVGATANDLVFGTVAMLQDPTLAVRSVMRLGAAGGEGSVDIQEGRYLQGAGKITGDVGAMILTAEGGYRAATAPMRAAASEARIQYARERIIETVREANGEGTRGAVVRVPEAPPGAPPTAVAAAQSSPAGARVVELHPEVMEALEAAKAEQSAASPAIAARLAARAANDPAAAVAMERTASPAEINYSQRTVSENVQAYTEDMRAGQWDWTRSGPLRVLERDGQLVSYDNRRLLAAQTAKLDRVPIQIVDERAQVPGGTRTWGEAFESRFNDPRNVAAGGPVPATGLKTKPTIMRRRRGG